MQPHTPIPPEPFPFIKSLNSSALALSQRSCALEYPAHLSPDSEVLKTSLIRNSLSPSEKPGAPFSERRLFIKAG